MNSNKHLNHEDTTLRQHKGKTSFLLGQYLADTILVPIMSLNRMQRTSLTAQDDNALRGECPSKSSTPHLELGTMIKLAYKSFVIAYM